MDEGTKTTKRQITAREYLFWAAVGLVLAVVGISSGNGTVVALGSLIAAACGFGLLWRLLDGR